MRSPLTNHPTVFKAVLKIRDRRAARKAIHLGIEIALLCRKLGFKLKTQDGIIYATDQKGRTWSFTKPMREKK